MAPTPSYIPPPAVPLQLADRGVRLGAALIDGLIGTVISSILIFGVIGFAVYGDLSLNQPLLAGMVSTLTGYAIFLGIHGKFLAESGQTIGKKALGIRIANLDGSKPEFGQLAFKRYLFFLLPIIPYVGGLLVLINILTIFRDNRRCLHDDFAGTVVVKA
jgi:uncharacterized RDD family membrane protein YckC